VAETDLLEDPLPDGRRFAAGEPVELRLRPFEIRSLRFSGR
jgi:hypothetical protein